jgi:hypothetical protein
MRFSYKAYVSVRQWLEGWGSVIRVMWWFVNGGVSVGLYTLPPTAATIHDRAAWVSLYCPQQCVISTDHGLSYLGYGMAMTNYCITPTYGSGGVLKALRRQ